MTTTPRSESAFHGNRGRILPSYLPLLLLLLTPNPSSSFLGNNNLHARSKITQKTYPLVPECGISQIPIAATPSSSSSSSSGGFEDENDQQEDMETMRREIETLRNEARQRIKSLSARMPVPPEPTQTRRIDRPPPPEAMMEMEMEPNLMDSVLQRSLKERRIRTATNESRRSGPSDKTEYSSLDDTLWKVTLNIGRETGTWMPKTWGVSGERILLNLVIRFSPDQLYDREDFLGGLGGANVCRVEGSAVTLGPSMTEGSRIFPVLKTGGWRIARGEGPMGTDVLRFYFEVDHSISHSGGDVYCPRGRVYCTCGYFPLSGAPNGKKQALTKLRDDLARDYQGLKDEIDGEGFVSLKKIQLMRDLYKLNTDLEKIRTKLNRVKVTEPERSLLRLSKKRDVGLTKEGGICCAVERGPGREYHILGKFGLAAVDPKKNIKERLLP